ncbi:MAG: tol-pal system protein YbgF [Zetaproteobacteria bacterium CG2_30_46_52]|nr:MAG: tol-pal system protein YbgF [Zetaproteobacteria bacterium CG2_30_46_52]
MYYSKPLTLSVALSLALLTSCASKKAEPEAWLQDKDLVVQSLQDAHTGNAKLLEKVEALESRISSLELASNKQSAQIDALTFGLEEEKKKAAQRKSTPINTPVSNTVKTKALNKRLDDLSAKLKVPAVVTDNSDEKNQYTAAYLALKSSRYDESSLGFSKVVRDFPKGEFTDQAYYWLGESYVAQGRNKDAVEAFTMVANNFPQSPKHAAALLKLASVYESLNMIGDARAVLNRVTKEHPDSRSAERARVQLSNLAPADAGTKP